jgi:hypothetical protein
MEDNWEIARVFNKLYLAEIGKQVLEDNGIEAVILNQKDSAINSIGDVYLYVHKDNLEKAKQLLAQV